MAIGVVAIVSHLAAITEMINLGDKVQDKVSGFTGIVLARMECLFEATECRVHPQEVMEDGRLAPAEWIAEDRLLVLEDRKIVGFVSVAGKQTTAENYESR